MAGGIMRFIPLFPCNKKYYPKSKDPIYNVSKYKYIVNLDLYQDSIMNYFDESDRCKLWCEKLIDEEQSVTFEI